MVSVHTVCIKQAMQLKNQMISKAKRKAAGQKAARTRKRNLAKRRAAAKKGAAKRKRKGSKRKSRR